MRWRWRYCENSCEDGGDSGGWIITDAKTMYNYLKTKLTRKTKIQNFCNHSRREFFLVEVNRDRPDRAIKSSIKGTRKLHSVRGITPGVIQTRSLGCVCSYCITGEGGECSSLPYVGAWNTQELCMQKDEGRRGRGARIRGTGRGVRTRGVGRGALNATGRGRTGVRIRGRRRGRGVRTRGGGRGDTNHRQNMQSSEGEHLG